MPLDNDDIKALIAILQKGLTDETDVSSSKPRSKRTSKPKIAKKKSDNKFEKMAEFNMCKEDIEIDKKIIKPPPSIRNRPFEYVKVQCRVCGKQEKVPSTLLDGVERYKCNKCSTGAG